MHCYCANYYSTATTKSPSLVSDADSAQYAPPSRCLFRRVPQMVDPFCLQVMNEGVSARYDSFGHQAQPQAYQDMLRDDSSREERRGRPRERKGMDSGKSRQHS
ncbi:hypothetical protein PG996_007051 [Apiospora saccharicola]|uniref:Uncharacterized protein n=1 Tax=Apiospora saccharicola TaxID=335842 RepID=A0ABR1VD42_9PEZI